jgi:hypothetical protein
MGKYMKICFESNKLKDKMVLEKRFLFSEMRRSLISYSDGRRRLSNKWTKRSVGHGSMRFQLISANSLPTHHTITNRSAEVPPFTCSIHPLCSCSFFMFCVRLLFSCFRSLFSVPDVVYLCSLFLFSIRILVSFVCSSSLFMFSIHVLYCLWFSPSWSWKDNKAHY